MSETPPNDQTPEPQTGETPPSADEAPALNLIVEYLKDLSFENPGAPMNLTQDNSALAQNLNIEINISRPVPDQKNHYEVELMMSMTAKKEDVTVYVVEINYAGLYHVQNIPEEHLGPAFAIECPRMLFPFARRVFADAIRDGGFRPPMLEPVDFAAIYQARMQQVAAQKNAAGANAEGAAPVETA